MRVSLEVEGSLDGWIPPGGPGAPLINPIQQERVGWSPARLMLCRHRDGTLIEPVKLPRGQSGTLRDRNIEV